LEFSERTLFKTFAIICGVFNEQVKNIEKTKALIVVIVSCRATVKATIQRVSDVRIKPS